MSMRSLHAVLYTGQFIINSQAPYINSVCLGSVIDRAVSAGPHDLHSLGNLNVEIPYSYIFHS